ncbi:HEAT repeat domain-containing protein [Saccharibacillus sacchari]|uniref:HEAT repeat domain-containing protein n=1 Tax=Saccharibacillus sacchari TaxID=456493 RepID=A0ACC6P7J9_9BACL
MDDYLRILLKDPDQYVQRRALLAMAERTSSSAAECAWKRITDDDFMLRLVSLRILEELVSSRLIEALELLSSDPHPLVRQEVESIIGNGYGTQLD